MDPILKPLCLVLLLGFPVLAGPEIFPNKIVVDIDQNLVYKRRIFNSFQIGTEIRYQFVGKYGRDEDLNSDQKAEYWLLTLTKELNLLGLRIDNTLRFFGDVRKYRQAGLNVTVGKEFSIKDSIVFFPAAKILTYSLNSVPENRGWHHRLEGLVGITMGVEFLF
jgi:hypothetical protein